MACNQFLYLFIPLKEFKEVHFEAQIVQFLNSNSRLRFMPALIKHRHLPVSIGLSGFLKYGIILHAFTSFHRLFSKLSKQMLVCARVIKGAKGDLRIRAQG